MNPWQRALGSWLGEAPIGEYTYIRLRLTRKRHDKTRNILIARHEKIYEGNESRDTADSEVDERTWERAGVYRGEAITMSLLPPA